MITASTAYDYYTSGTSATSDSYYYSEVRAEAEEPGHMKLYSTPRSHQPRFDQFISHPGQIAQQVARQR